MQKKYLPLFFLSFLFFYACSSSTEKSTQEGKVIISGEVKNPPKGATDIQLEKFNVKINDYEPFQETELVDNQFEFALQTEEADFYRLRVFDKQDIYFVASNENVQITVDASQADLPYEIKGSKDTEYYQAANQIFEDFQKKSHSLQTQYNMVSSPEERAELDITFQKLNKENMTRLKSFIDSIMPSVVAIYAANALDFDADFEYVEALGKRFEKELPNSIYTQSFSERLEITRPLALGKVAPDISLLSPEGKELTLSTYRGKWVLIDFWASWCGPCRRENPFVKQVYAEYKSKGLEIYGVSLDENPEKWKEAIAQDGIPWLQVLDNTGQFAQTYQVVSIPTTILLDPEGKIIAKNLRGENLVRKLEEVMKEGV